MAVRQMRNKNYGLPPRYFIFFQKEKTFVFHLFGHRRKPTVNSKFFQIQLLPIGTEQKSGENQAEASISERRDLLPAITTYNNNNNSRSSSQKGKSTGSCKKKR